MEAEQVGADQMLLQNPQNVGLEKVINVLEEISYTADSELAMANLSRHSGLLCNIRAALARIEEKAFGFCLCCRTTNRRGLNTS